MPLEMIGTLSSRWPAWIVAAWLTLAVVVGVGSPNLTRLAAEGQSKLLGREAESRRAAELVKECWPDQAYESTAVAALYRPSGLTEADRQFATDLARRFEAPGRPGVVLRVLGPTSQPEIAKRLVSADGAVSMVIVPLDAANVAPSAHEAIGWLQGQAASAMKEAPEAAGLQVLWTGDAVIGRDYMHQVQVSLDRAAVATVVLLMIVLLIVYRSFWLALVPLTTIGVSLVIARGVLAWLTLGGWRISSLVELFLVAILFGTGTDFCLFLSWRFGEHFNPRNPAGVMRMTLSRSFTPLVTSAGTIIIGLMLMGTTKFTLFATTGPSVALGLAITLVATLTLTPALLVLLARFRPRCFEGFTAASNGYWEAVGRTVMARPLRSWALTMAAMIPLVVVGLRTHFVMDLLSEMPPESSSAQSLSLVLSKFDPGMTAPLTIVLESDRVDLTSSEGLALIDDVSRLLSHQRRHQEVRSATQPLGSPEPLNRARLASRLGEVDQGFQQLADGGTQLQKGLNEGAAKLRAALWLERKTGLNITGGAAAGAPERPAPPPPEPPSDDAVSQGLKTAADAVMWSQGVPATWNVASLRSGFNQLILEGAAQGARQRAPKTSGLFDAAVRLVGGAPAKPPAASTSTPPPPQPPKPGETLLSELTRAAEGAGKIALGAERAHREVSGILSDPLGRRALNRLLITPETVKENPELLKSFAAYITPDGRHARIDVTLTDRVFSNGAMDQVETLRRRLDDYLGEYEGINVTASVAGANAESADVRALTHTDQVQSWFVVPIGVFLVLMIALRDPWACFNLVATMVLTYAFALGATHLVFVSLLGAEGLDWKVPYFLFVLLVAVGVDYNVFLMSRLHEETARHGFRGGIIRAIGQTGGLISSAAAITACSFASFLFSPLGSLRQLGFALVVGIAVDAVLVRPLLVPCGHWLLRRSREVLAPRYNVPSEQLRLTTVPD
ncbi:MAG: MMPL family transporter [Paludisphaera borealis]|uniref:MMPL family transporter n=1 Tax=Paludisphaera borealis TaxID=1387353 RepID=UPI0028504194|nr:MMPL family transporter [Paludisphaera borealis]MDR3617846.1 MMPL family transporter [Paludisphaera borealis]